MNILELRQTVEILDGIAPRRVVDLALSQAGINRDLLRTGPGYVPYRIEAVLIETIARKLGERSLGAVIGQRFDYDGFEAFARYVMTAPNLSDALVRSRRALPFLHPGAAFSLRLSDDNLVFGYRSGLENSVGHQHLSEGSIFLITHVVKYFLGQEWQPVWIEMAISGAKDEHRLQDLSGTEVRGGAEILGFSVPISDLHAPNPTAADPHKTVTFEDLPSLMGVQPPKTATDKVRDIMRALLVLGDLSEESVAQRLSIGTLTLQRALMAEATSYRELRNQLIEARARALLSDSALDIAQIANALGYSEPNSFRRAFRTWTGMSPRRFREERCPQLH